MQEAGAGGARFWHQVRERCSATLHIALCASSRDNLWPWQSPHLQNEGAAVSIPFQIICFWGENNKVRLQDQDISFHQNSKFSESIHYLSYRRKMAAFRGDNGGQNTLDVIYYKIAISPFPQDTIHGSSWHLPCYLGSMFPSTILSVGADL